MVQQLMKAKSQNRNQAGISLSEEAASRIKGTMSEEMKKNKKSVRKLRGKRQRV